MDPDLFFHALETGNADHLNDEAKAHHFQELLDEYRRIHAWAAVCLGDDVARFGGLPVDHQG